MATCPRPEDMLAWATNELQYHPQEHFAGDPLLDADSFRKVCRGNLAPVWKFLTERVRSEKSVRDIRRNLIVHGKGEKRGLNTNPTLEGELRDVSKEHGREEALIERAAAQAEVARLRDQVADLERSLQQQMEDVAREELQKDKDALDGRDQDFRTAALDAYQRRMSESVALFRDCKKRLDLHLAHARFAKQSGAKPAPQQVFERHLAGSDSSARPAQTQGGVPETPGVSGGLNWGAIPMDRKNGSGAKRVSTSGNSGSESRKEAALDERQNEAGRGVGKPLAAAPLLETAAERQVREACETLSALLEKRIAESIPEFSDDLDVDSDTCTPSEAPRAGSESPRSPEWQGAESLHDRNKSLSERNDSFERNEVTYLGSEVPLGGVIRDVLGDIPSDVVDSVLRLLRSPKELLRALASCTGTAAEELRAETERIDIRGDAEKLRYKYENDKIVEDAAAFGADAGGARTALALLRERQKAHVEQFMRAQEARGLAAESERATEEAMRAILETSAKSGTQETILKLQVWALERELAGARAAASVLESEAARLSAAKAERKRAEALLRRKWQRITEFDARRSALEALHNDLRKENDELAAAWENLSAKARALSLQTIVRFGPILREIAQTGRNMVAREMEAFVGVPHRLLPPQLAETGTDAEESQLRATLFDAASGNPAALFTLHRARTARHHQPALQSTAATSSDSPIRTRGLVAAGGQSGHTLDKALPRVLQGLSFCQPEYASVAGVVSAVAKQLEEVEALSALVSDGRFAVDEASDARPELLNHVEDTSVAAVAQDEEMTSETLTRIQAAIDEARFAIEDSERVERLIHEWWDQPAFAAVPWVTMDGESASTLLSRVRQLQSALRTKAELNQLERALTFDQS